MARGSEDKDVRDSQPKPDNPFIKFRQFADEQISSLLQGIIGLPSAFSKTPGNARWANFDDELRRRDELQARQQELRESEARKANQGTLNEKATGDADIPVKKYSGWNKVSDIASESPGTDGSKNGKCIKDVPLYSPVSRSLFAHLEASGKAEKDWDPLWNPPRMYSFDERKPGSPTDNMTAIQDLCFNELKVLPHFRSDYSLLPYLLFSSYSPLRLQQHGRTSPTNPKGSVGRIDLFPYCNAFEDLILVSQGRPMTGPWNPSVSATIPRSVGGPYFGFHWIGALQRSRLLQQEEGRMEQMMSKPISVPDRISFFGLGNSDVSPDTDAKNEAHRIFKREGVDKSKAEPESNTESTSPKTEEEMYERFLRLMSPMSPNTAKPDLAMVEELFKLFGQEFKDMKPSEILKTMADEFLPRTPEEEKQLRSLADEFLRDFMPSLHQGLKDREQVEGKPKPSTSASPTASDKVVSSTTTSEHTTNDDGSVETSVTVWKRFADGRETVTTTTHLEDPARDGDGNPAQQEADTSNPQEGKETKKEPVKKGWFWN